HFLVQWKFECRFLNGTRRVRYLHRTFYDRQEILRFDSARGEYEAVTALGKGEAEALNRDKHELQYRKGEVNRFCRHNYEGFQRDSVVGRRVGIWMPYNIKVRWLKNGRPEEEGVAFGEELQNGDWTYQLQVMLETQPQRGDIYTCQVEHASLEAPITVQWEPRSSNSAKSKLWTGIVAAVIGVIFFTMGLSLYLKSKKGESMGLDERL
ncbi:HLA class II histocompatibility antigen, DRB1-9 beta chain-like, partial [Protobothrops mucrosquamatus]|uniref:HLA class II histocompatibility antigen, DRB1-9 beta chain-like n=1 Tax=Protobothrops mucrosquamatus TaxID=103944 RepID=UPI000775AEE1